MNIVIDLPTSLNKDNLVFIDTTPTVTSNGLFGRVTYTPIDGNRDGYAETLNINIQNATVVAGEVMFFKKLIRKIKNIYK